MQGLHAKHVAEDDYVGSTLPVLVYIRYCHTGTMQLKQIIQPISLKLFHFIVWKKFASS